MPSPKRWWWLLYVFAAAWAGSFVILFLVVVRLFVRDIWKGEL